MLVIATVAREKDEFLATLTHELRSPLGSILSSVEIMRRAAGNAAVIEQARATIERQVLHMQRLIDDSLDAGRDAAHRVELRKTRVDLGVILDDAVAATRSSPEAIGRALIITAPPSQVFLDADPVRLTQVFANLLTNACKYTDAGGRIDIAVGRWGSRVIVRVSDDGIGIPPHMLAKVFQRFVQVDGSAKRVQGGLGIGLALAKQLVELHGGGIVAHSDGLGRGSEFVVSLPLRAGRPVIDLTGRRRPMAALLLAGSTALTPELLSLTS